MMERLRISTFPLWAWRVGAQMKFRCTFARTRVCLGWLVRFRPIRGLSDSLSIFGRLVGLSAPK